MTFSTFRRLRPPSLSGGRRHQRHRLRPKRSSKRSPTRPPAHRQAHRANTYPRNQQYSVTALTDGRLRNVTERYAYDALRHTCDHRRRRHKHLRTSLPKTIGTRTQGEEYDVLWDLGGVSLRARMYDSVAGRFLLQKIPSVRRWNGLTLSLLFVWPGNFC